MNKNNKELNNLINEFNLKNKITLLGELNNTKSFLEKLIILFYLLVLVKVFQT